MEREPHDEPSEVDAEEGAVLVEGPDGIAYSMTPGAAYETSGRLMFGAAKAKGQQIAKARKRTRGERPGDNPDRADHDKSSAKGDG